MCKRSFVSLFHGKKKYRILVEDIQEVHRVPFRKRPNLPTY